MGWKLHCFTQLTLGFSSPCELTHISHPFNLSQLPSLPTHWPTASPVTRQTCHHAGSLCQSQPRCLQRMAARRKTLAYHCRTHMRIPTLPPLASYCNSGCCVQLSRWSGQACSMSCDIHHTSIPSAITVQGIQQASLLLLVSLPTHPKLAFPYCQFCFISISSGR